MRKTQKNLVSQVSRGDYELILAGNLDRVGVGRVFISLGDSEMSMSPGNGMQSDKLLI